MRHTQAIPLRRRYLRHMHQWLHQPTRRLRHAQVSDYVVGSERLPVELEGLRIVQLSDIHYSLYQNSLVISRAVEMANALDPDLIALTGDFVTASTQFIDPVSELLSHLRARYGVFAVLGNHDFRAGAEQVTAALQRRNIAVLRNATHLLPMRGATLRLVGIDDSRQNPDLHAALGQSDPELFTLLLAHNPVALEEAAAEGIDFVLSGHTHGGQIRLGFAENFYQRFLPEGFFAKGRTQLYISRGLGKVIVPVRLGCPPEVASFTLVRAASTMTALWEKTPEVSSTAEDARR